jgi:hypothetical protein
LFNLTGLEPGPAAMSMQVWSDLVSSQWPRLITGHGFDMSNRGLTLDYLPQQTPRSLLFVLWYDLGVVGATAFAVLTARVFLLVRKIPAPVAPAVLAGLVAILSLAFFGIATAQIWWVTLLDCGVIALAMLVKGIYQTHRPAAPTIEAATPALGAAQDLAAAPAERGL